ncbi:MAG: hypothetical protein JHC71_03265 [Blastococcus sp.]|nr:hypothetical protein [Blastococcus sp.]
MTDGRRAPTREIGDDATAEVAERAREELRTAAARLLLYAAGAMLFLEPQPWSIEFSMGAAAFVLVLLGTVVWQFGTARGREGEAGRLLAEYAVLRHVDPGVGRRAPADEAARDFVRGRFLGWLWLAGSLALPLVLGQWDQPAWAVTGAVLLGIAAVVQVVDTERQARAGRRWLADPPGPPRD